MWFLRLGHPNVKCLEVLQHIAVFGVFQATGGVDEDLCLARNVEVQRRGVPSRTIGILLVYPCHEHKSTATGLYAAPNRGGIQSQPVLDIVVLVQLETERVRLTLPEHCMHSVLYDEGVLRFRCTKVDGGHLSLGQSFQVERHNVVQCGIVTIHFAGECQLGGQIKRGQGVIRVKPIQAGQRAGRRGERCSASLLPFFRCGLRGNSSHSGVLLSIKTDIINAHPADIGYVAVGHTYG